MESFILLLKSLLFLSVTTLAVDENSRNNDRLTNKGHLLNNVIIPLHYKVYLNLHESNLHSNYSKIFSRGECTISILVNHPTRDISFHVDRSQLLLLRALIIDKKKSANSTENVTHYRPLYGSYNDKTDIYTASFAEVLFGYYDLYLTYINTITTDDDNKGSIFRTSFIIGQENIEINNMEINIENRAWIVITNLWPIGARRLFPCWDNPEFQANFTINIKHSQSYKVLSNMPIQETYSAHHPDISTRFEETPQIPTYHVAAVLLPDFRSVNIRDIHSIIVTRWKLITHHFHYIKFTFLFLEKITKYFKLQRMYLQNLKQLSHVAIPGFRHDAVSNLGLIFYRETAVIFDEKEDPLMRQVDIARLVGHAVAYQCLNNRIGPSSWSYMWLNQGISTLLAIDAIEQTLAYPMKDLFVVQTLQESLRLDIDSIMKPLVSEVNGPSDDDSDFYFAYYLKAPAILRMLQHILGEEVFQNGIDKYLSNDSSYSGKTNIEVFWTAMQAAYEENKYDEEHFNIKERMEAWTTKEHYPVIKVTQNETYITVTTENTNASEKKWWIPYHAHVIEDLHFCLSLQPIRYILSGENQITYKNEKDKFIIANLKQIGYYRVSYDAQSLEKIMNYLTNAKTNVHVLNYAQIDDAFYFLIKGQLDLSVFVKLTKLLILRGSKHSNYIAWYPMFKAFEYMSSFFPFEKSSYIKGEMIETLDKLHQHMGYETIDQKSLNLSYHQLTYHTINSLKQEAARWACAFGSSECKKQAYFELETYLTYRKGYYNPLPWWKEWINCNGLITADNNIWNEMFVKYMEEPNYILSKCLACSENFSIIRKYLELITPKHYDEKIKDCDRIYIFHSVVVRHAKNDTTLNYILENFDNVKPRNMSMTVALIDIINHVYSKSSLDKINKFLDDYFATWPIDLSKHPLIDDELYNKITNCTIRDVLDLIVLGKIAICKRKVKIRLSEIKRHVNHFSNFYL